MHDMNSTAMGLVQRYYAWADDLEIRFFDLMDPVGNYKLHPGADYPLANLGTVLLIMSGYLLFVLLGSAIMKMGVPAINTEPLRFVYNPCQVIICSYIFMETCVQVYKHNYSILPCNVFNPREPVMANVVYAFFLSKFLDFFDTLFIVLGKKWRQLSVLHVYHHLSVIFIFYLVFRVAHDADIFFTVCWNSFVHIIMYTYYFICMHTRDIWWKKYLTTLQIIQFVSMNLHEYLTVSKQCQDHALRVVVFSGFYVQSLLWLFINFYIRSYWLNRKQQVKDQPADKKTK